jgi:hypothetical protein
MTRTQYLFTWLASLVFVGLAVLGMVKADEWLRRPAVSEGPHHGLVTRIGEVRDTERGVYLLDWDFDECPEGKRGHWNAEHTRFCGFTIDELKEMAAHAAEVRK